MEVSFRAREKAARAELRTFEGYAATLRQTPEGETGEKRAELRRPEQRMTDGCILHMMLKVCLWGFLTLG